MELAPGSRLGPYEIVAPLGSGGMGEDCRVRDTPAGRANTATALATDLKQALGDSAPRST